MLLGDGTAAAEAKLKKIAELQKFQGTLQSLDIVLSRRELDTTSCSIQVKAVPAARYVGSSLAGD